jgi:hypothetical protein
MLDQQRIGGNCNPVVQERGYLVQCYRFGSANIKWPVLTDSPDDWFTYYLSVQLDDSWTNLYTQC